MIATAVGAMLFAVLMLLVVVLLCLLLLGFGFRCCFIVRRFCRCRDLLIVVVPPGTTKTVSFFVLCFLSAVNPRGSSGRYILLF